jgi:hypothetical protein
MSMPSARRPKKTNTIEIRLADEEKAAFVEQCRQEGRTVSETIRALIAERVAPSEIARKTPVPPWRFAVAALIGAVLGAGVAAPSFARPACDSQRTFEHLDINGDGAETSRHFQSG